PPHTVTYPLSLHDALPISHLLGTTSFGNDVLSQFLHGFRIALLVGLVAAVAVGFISTVVGVISGYFGGYVDDILMRITDIALSRSEEHTSELQSRENLVCR